MVLTHTRINTNTAIQSLEHSCGITEVTCVMVKGSLMLLVQGNWRALGDPLAKKSIFLSFVPIS